MNGDLMTEHCWDLNPDCLLKGMAIIDSKCPAYQNKKPCWEINWNEELAKMDESTREYWRHFLKNHCKSCPVYSKYRDIISLTIDTI